MECFIPKKRKNTKKNIYLAKLVLNFFLWLQIQIWTSSKTYNCFVSLCDQRHLSKFWDWIVRSFFHPFFILIFLETYRMVNSWYDVKINRNITYFLFWHDLTTSNLNDINLRRAQIIFLPLPVFWVTHLSFHILCNFMNIYEIEQPLVSGD